MSDQSDPRTLAFYDAQAETYAARNDRTDVGENLAAFLARLPQGAHVLDLGSGGGQHSVAMEARGFEVTALDGSAGLAEVASRKLSRPVRVMQFHEFEDVDAFDAIWAHASLLHVPADALAGVLARLHRALRPGGVFHASFKTGGEPGRDTLGRYYNRPTEETLRAALNEAGAWDTMEFEAGEGGGYDKQPTLWISFTATKPAAP